MDADARCPEELYQEHIAAFVASFVQRHRRDRWLHLLTARPKQLFKNSHKLFEHLDKSRCTQALTPSSLRPADEGVFLDFHSDSVPLLVTAERALELGFGQDALFSVIPGKIAVYFFHEDFVMECRS